LAGSDNDVLLEDADALGAVLDGALAHAKFVVVGRLAHTFSDPTAVTVARILAESHAVAHSWPEHRMLTVDIFSCAADDRTEAFIQALTELTKTTVVARTDDPVLDSSAGPRFALRVRPGS
jgi:S-adenosylmethionine/arginine decarboxylase-like enzyme